MYGNHTIRSQNKQSTRNFIYNFKYITFKLKSRSITRNHVSIRRRSSGALLGHYRYLNFRTYQALQQGNFWANRRLQVWYDQIKVEWLLPKNGWCCIHIWIQISSYDCDDHIWSSYTHLIPEHHPALKIYHTIYGGLTLWNHVYQKLRSRFGAPPHKKLWIRTTRTNKAGNNWSTAP